MKPHKSDCPDCDGTGHDEEDGSVCQPCDGGGKVNWEWDPDNIGQCEYCGAKSEQLLMGCGPDADVWICRDCVQLAHREQCGCDAEGWA